jgi:GNAT superfamily N-acetyltransferase
MLIRPCNPGEEMQILSVINDGAEAYRNVIPASLWKEPYMPESELRREIAAGVGFWCAEEGGLMTGVMGLQHVEDVSLIRHSYVRTASQGRGIGRGLLEKLVAETDRPVLAGTWDCAEWAVRFYTRNGFTLVSRTEGELLFRRYWKISAGQAANSVVLGDARWCTERGSARG